MGSVVADLNVLETGNGGDILLQGRDLSVIYGWQNMPYFALFGGNVEQSTPSLVLPEEQRKDYWGNSLFHANEPELQFNSLTERILMNVELSSSGRLQIEQAVKKDLEFMQAFAIVEVEVSITGVDRIQILIRFTKPDRLQQREFIFIWDNTTSSLTYVAPTSGQYLGTESGGFITTESGELISLW